MKSLVVLSLSLAFLSVNAEAHHRHYHHYQRQQVSYTYAPPEFIYSTTGFTSALLLFGNLRKQAEVIQNDAQAYMQDGSLSSLLEKRIEEIVAHNPGMSEAEAVDALNEWAQTELATPN